MNEAIIDPFVFREISELMEDELPVFIGTYLGNTLKLLEGLKQAVLSGDKDAVFHNAHQLKGGSGSIGATQVLQIAKQIEEIAQNSAVEAQLDGLIIELQKAYVAVEAELKVHL